MKHNPTDTVRLIASLFATKLLADIGTENMTEVVKRNAEEKEPKVCHSHDFCDANMVMAAAVEQVTGTCPVPMTEEQQIIWNLAWDEAKARGFAGVLDFKFDPEKNIDGTGGFNNGMRAARAKATLEHYARNGRADLDQFQDCLSDMCHFADSIEAGLDEIHEAIEMAINRWIEER